jgi:hypothetical protein
MASEPKVSLNVSRKVDSQQILPRLYASFARHEKGHSVNVGNLGRLLQRIGGLECTRSNILAHMNPSGIDRHAVSLEERFSLRTGKSAQGIRL